MSYHRFNIYRFQTYDLSDLHLQELPAIPHISISDSQSSQYNSLQNSSIISTPYFSQPIIPLPPWRPSTRLRKLHTHFQNTILSQCICLPCAYCGILVYPTKAKWDTYDEVYLYPLEKNLQNINVYIREQDSTCRNLDANKYTEYRTLVELCAAANWLKQHNKYLKPFARLITATSLHNESYRNPFLIATHLSSDISAPSFQEGDIVLLSADFPTEIHNEDFYYTHLMAGFVQMPTTTLPLSFDNPDLEPLLFPDLFPDGNGHFFDQNTVVSENDSLKTETYGKYIKHRLLCVDSRFHLHPYWPHYSYLRLEKLRNHQNTMRLWRQKQSDKIYRPPTAAELITHSVYSGKRTIDETKTTTLPSFIRTGDTYFNEKLLHINAMIREYKLPSLFITLTAAESKWTHLKDILKSTDNKDTVPTNRPLHTALHFNHRKKEFWNHIWKKPANSNWRHLIHFFKRVEFQNRGAPHTHSVLWVEESIDEMIAENLIRSDLPNPNTEPELYQLVLAHQIHTCSPKKCGGPAPPGQVCKKKFPHRWVVPYHPATLLIWNAHMNIQYVSNKNLGKYLTKYVVKSEPSYVFNISEGDKYHEYIVARRLSSMECMYLLLGEAICTSSVQVKYLPTEPPTTQSRAIRLISTIMDDDDDPYWKDTIEKYFARPHTEEFNNITYPDYYKNYTLTTKKPSSNEIYKDDFNYYVIRRTSPLVIRYRHLKIQNGESFFYQQLLLSLPCRSESELLGNYTSYREKYLNLYPDFQNSLQYSINITANENRYLLQNQFNIIITNILENLANNVTSQIADILTKQLDCLKLTPPIFPQNAMLNLPEEQYILYNTIVSNLEPLQSKKYPYFFITGSGGVGKSYITMLIIDWIKSQNKTYLLTAPTGVAAQNVGGSTIHSALRLMQSGSGYQSLAFYDLEFKKKLQTIEILIIEEISMVSATLFNFISNLFARIHNSNIAFGGISVIVVGDLAQLPPVRDEEFYQMLEEIRLDAISDNTWKKLEEKAANYNNNQSSDTLLTTTHIVGYCETSTQINNTICNILPINNDKYLISESIDVLEVRLQQGARVMYLNNSLSEDGICNGTIGVITDLNKQHPSVQVAFCTHGAIIQKWITRETVYFYLGGQHASRTQFPLQNSFSLTVHKTQSLTLPNTSLDLSQLFAPGHAYTAISRCPKWENIQIINLDRDSFKVDPNVIKEYSRLKQIASQPLPIS
ncbi:hypothetical protein RclHR1_09310007 [Rhizophagus clarus]|uniref:ATP-dependent DNA helicase n=1 Tax=Rhizophagus clarus TaxID=94130 RepID=A0A2Z6SI96_9GLOM|nr:hypothetical protein RclHR1_09310007 [Rhizophagus clarus]